MSFVSLYKILLTIMIIMMHSCVHRPGNWHSTSETVLRWWGRHRRQGGQAVDWWDRTYCVVQWCQL